MTILIPLLTFLAVTSIGGALIVAHTSRRGVIHARLQDLVADPAATDSPNRSPLLDALGRIGHAVTPDKDAPNLRQRLAHAGFFSPAAAPIYVGVRVVVMAVAVIGAAGLLAPMDLALPVKVMIAVAAGWFASLAPVIYIEQRKARRATEVRHHLPDAVDLLEICVTAGLGLDTAWNTVADEVRRVSPILADEMALTNLEIHLGASRAEAMRRMAGRTDSDDVRSLVGVLVQSERFGTSIAQALRTFATSMREIRSARAAESAEKMGVKMLVPMIVFILPAILIVMAGPAAIKIIKMFQEF